MKSMINISSGTNMKDDVEPLATAIIGVLAAIGTNHIDRETGIAALGVLRSACGENSVHLSGCHLSNQSNDRPSAVTSGFAAEPTADDLGESEDD